MERAPFSIAWLFVVQVLLLAAGCATIDIEVHGRRGDTYINRGQYDLAIAEFNRVLEIVGIRKALLS
jgi:hypothetical protein